ncbi:hypothetical protein KP509_39G043000 [Ceratopteris richardii]|uniref:Dof-type domain-containing protein n=1 Tax=Ceratopteris richardii TaxID=49495 RepID=A0A8T2Q0P7_CERRI|nr:hypothetical protein KP509_39G043000 [Ceratopteris richardii]
MAMKHVTWKDLSSIPSSPVDFDRKVLVLLWRQSAPQTSSSAQPASTAYAVQSPIIADATVAAQPVCAAPTLDRQLPPTSLSSAPADQPRRLPLKVPHPSEVLRCPRCDSMDTKFCYYNNYSLSQPRYFCKGCKRYWTAGGALRNVPVGGGLRKSKRAKMKLAAADAQAQSLTAQAAVSSGLKSQQQVPEAPAEAQPSGVLVPDLTGFMHPNIIASSSHGSSYTNGEVSLGTSFFPEAAQAPQYYSGFASSYAVPYNNQGSPAPPAAMSTPYVISHCYFSPDPSSISSTRENGDAALATSDACYSQDAVKQEKEAEGQASQYDWQFISEGLFNGGCGAPDSGFLYPSSSGWPDFSQFNDPGPG